jgi:hypothetical protein
MPKPVFSLLGTGLLMCLFSSCGVNLETIPGTYQLKGVAKTRLTIYTDSTFTFVKINSNPYLYVSGHPELLNYITQGRWRLHKNSLVLDSDDDSLPNSQSEMRFDTSKNLTYSTFRFYDIYGDSVDAAYVVYPDGSQFIRGFDLKFGFYRFSADMLKTKSVKFVFFGYKDWEFVNADNLNHNVNVVLKPIYRPGIFQHSTFKVKRKELVEIIDSKKYKFKKLKHGT